VDDRWSDDLESHLFVRRRKQTQTRKADAKFAAKWQIVWYYIFKISNFLINEGEGCFLR
jgi:hypothetical protein